MFTFSDVTLYSYQHGAQTGSIGGAVSGDLARECYEKLLAEGKWRVISETDNVLILQCGRMQRFARFERT